LNYGHFAYCMVISPTGHFACKTLLLQDTSSTEHFTYWTVCLLFGHFAYKARFNLANFSFDFVYCLRSGESNQYA